MFFFNYSSYKVIFMNKYTYVFLISKKPSFFFLQLIFLLLGVYRKIMLNSKEHF